MKPNHLPRVPAACQPALRLAVALVALAGPAGVATAAGPAGGMSGTVINATGLNDAVVSSGMPSSSLLARPAPYGGSTITNQTMLWTGGPRLSLGLGIAQRAAPLLPRTPAATGDAGLLIGLGLNTVGRTRLIWQTPLLRADGSDTAGAPRQMRMGLVFSLHDPYADLRRGMLTRIELSGQTALALRSRGGRLGLALTSRW